MNDKCDCPCHDITKQYPLPEHHTSLCLERRRTQLLRAYGGIGRDGNHHSNGPGLSRYMSERGSH